MIDDYTERFFNEYINAMLFYTTDDNDTSLDVNYSINDIDDDSLNRLKNGCVDFVKENWNILMNEDARQAGHDFWLTRNGHGTGFWDGDYDDKVGDILTESCKLYGEINPYIITQYDPSDASNDKSKIYI